MPLRQTTGFVQSLLRLVGLDWTAPDFSTLCRRQQTLNVSLPYRGSTGPLNLLIDSTGIKAEGEGEWNARKHAGSKRRVWRKIHIGIDEETLEVRAVQVTGSNIGDAPKLPELLNKFHPIRTSVALLRMGRMTPVNTTRRLPPETPMQWSRHARMQSPGNQRAPEQLLVTMRSMRNDIWAAPCGDAGADTTVEAASKPKCTVSNYSANR